MEKSDLVFMGLTPSGAAAAAAAAAKAKTDFRLKPQI